MRAPSDPPDWATDANYPAGSDPWSGTPTKSAPDAGKIATGFVPDTDQAAEEVNWILANHADWINYLAGGGLLSAYSQVTYLSASPSLHNSLNVTSVAEDG